MLCLLQEFLGGIVVLFAALSSLSAALSGTIGAGLVGLAVAYSLKVNASALSPQACCTVTECVDCPCICIRLFLFSTG